MNKFFLVLLLMCLFAYPIRVYAVVDPVGWWKFDAGSGTTALDSGSGGNNGTFVNTPVWVTGHIGAGALQFVHADGDVVNLGTPAALNITGAITVSAWINPSSLPTVDNEYFGIFSKAWDGSAEQYVLRFRRESGVTVVEFYTYNGSVHGAAWTYGANITTGNWYHVVGRFDGTTWKVYVNNVERASTTDSTAPASSSANVEIGNESGTATREFDGIIDDVRIYNRALTTLEISDMYNQTEGAVATVRHRAIIVQ